MYQHKNNVHSTYLSLHMEIKIIKLFLQNAEYNSLFILNDDQNQFVSQSIIKLPACTKYNNILLPIFTFNNKIS